MEATKSLTKGVKDLTSLVIKYQHSLDSKTFQQIHDSVGDLIWSIIKYYDMLNYPPLVLEEIVNECESEVLFKCVVRFNEDRKAKFTTYYTWELKSCVRARKCQFLRRKRILLTSSLNQMLKNSTSEDSEGGDLGIFCSKSDRKTIPMVRKSMKDIFYGDSIFMKIPMEEKASV